LILQKITKTTENTAIAFTDGSCLNSPGPCGAGAILFVEEETTELKQPVCKRGSILGELIAIKIVLEYIDHPEIRRKIEQLTILSDSQTAIGLLTLHWKIENHKRITLEIFDKMKRIQKMESK
jgi:ribonuclease HI